MRTLCFTFMLLAMASLAYGDGPGDNAVEKVRPVPPPGVKIPDEVRKELESGAAALKAEIVHLLKSNSPKASLLLPDVEIYYNAVHYALKYDEFLVNSPNVANTTKDGKKKAKEQIDKETKDAIERNTKGQVESARKALKAGMERAKELAENKPSWVDAKGLVPRGYASKIDESIQPYVLVVPESFDRNRKAPWRLDFWCHGRGETMSELTFLNGGKGQFTPADTIVCHLYGRFCCANKFAGEVDLFEALEDIAAKYPIDRDRLVVRGFSMGGASTWQFATHFPSVFCAAAPGAGFAETPEFLKVFQNETAKPTAIEQKLWHLYNSTDYALNLFNLPTVAYSGEIDGQKQAADMMVKALDKEGMKIPHIIGPNTPHKYHPDSIPLINKLVDDWAEKGRPTMPEQVKFETWTLRYNQSHWVRIDGLEEHWKNTRVEAERKADKLNVKTQNVSAFTLFPARNGKLSSEQVQVIVDGQVIDSPFSKQSMLSLKSVAGVWMPVPVETVAGLHKVHGLQGPIDDAFMDRFIIVRPTGKSPNEAVSKWVDAEMNRAIVQWRKVFRGEAIVKDDKDVTAEDIASSNLVLWGDPHSNSVYAKINDKLPIKPKSDQPNVIPLLIYPNPLNPKKYVVTNSGFTFREYDALNNARQVPKLPDWALIDISTPPNSRYPGKVVEAGFFDENWKVK